MKNNAADIEVLFGIAEDYSKSSFELLKLQTIDKLSHVFSVLASRIVLVIVVALFALFLNLGLAFWIGEMIGSIYNGFFIIAGFYSLITIIVFYYKKSWIEEPVRNTIIDKMLEKEKE